MKISSNQHEGGQGPAIKVRPFGSTARVFAADALSAAIRRQVTTHDGSFAKSLTGSCRSKGGSHRRPRFRVCPSAAPLGGLQTRISLLSWAPPRPASGRLDEEGEVSPHAVLTKCDEVPFVSCHLRARASR
jgi:hypothetical protein